MDRVWIVFCHRGEKISSPDEIRMKRFTKQCTFFFFTSSFVQIATRVTPRNTRSLLNQGVVYVFRGRLSSGLPARAFDRSNSRNVEQVLVTETIRNHPIFSTHHISPSPSISLSKIGIENNLKKL